ncbi:class I SAM-dependent methyltransferase [Candidatus Uhrbacteria bacterium]|nr:class I SAM-dependent methyltransferase [Candidatus Uhrbacteria bacterium]
MNEPLVWSTYALVAIAIILVAIDIVALWVLARGAPYIPTKAEGVERILSLVEKRPNMRAVDIGSGDGRIVIALAKTGIESHGYEINPVLVQLSRKKIREANLEHLAQIHWKDLWKTNFSRYDVVTLFGVGYIMKRLEKKLQRELKPGSQVISLGFQFPTWPLKEKNGGLYIYIK